MLVQDGMERQCSKALQIQDECHHHKDGGAAQEETWPPVKNEIINLNP